jgi:hypothetical protein
MRSPHVFAAAALVAILTGPAATANPASPHVRGLSQPGRDLVTHASARSSVVRALMDAIEATDVVVYVTVEPLPEHQRSAYLSFLTAGGGLRYLVVKVDWVASPWEAIALLAHELQHAMEIAAAPEVRDAASLASLYSHIGWRSGEGQWETSRARGAGERARRELSSSAGSTM